MTGCMARKWGAFFTGTMAITVSWLCTSSAASNSWLVTCGPATPTGPGTLGPCWRCWSKRSVSTGPGCGSCYGPTVAFAAGRCSSWCERHGVHYVVGLAKNKRLNVLSAPLQADAQAQHQKSKEKVRLFGQFAYKAGRVGIASGGSSPKPSTAPMGLAPRYLVTSLEGEPEGLYDEVYCARGEVENRIKEQQLDLFSDRTSCHEWWRESVPTFVVVLCLRALRDAPAHRSGRHRTGTGEKPGRFACSCAKVGAVVVRNTRRVRLWFKVGFPLTGPVSPLPGLLLRLGPCGAGPDTE